MYSSILCTLCEKHEDNQESVILCPVLLDILPLRNCIDYGHIKGTTEQQTEFLQVYEQYIIICDELLDMSGQDRMVHSFIGGGALATNPILLRSI